MLRIRLTRMGAKKKPFYRVVVTERKQARDGRFVEIVGHYNPGTNPPSIELDLERLRHSRALRHVGGGQRSFPELVHRQQLAKRQLAIRQKFTT